MPRRRGPDLRVSGRLLPDHEIAALRERLRQWWDETEPRRPCRQRWCQRHPGRLSTLMRHRDVRAEGVPSVVGPRAAALTQRESMRLYRDVADVQAAVAPRNVTVLTRHGVATVPVAQFKRLSLEPLLQLIRDRGARTVLDFGCGQGANPLILRQLCPISKCGR